jgi:hypothetical protein
MSELRDIEPRVATPGTFNILGADSMVGKVKFVGANAVGPHLTVEFLNVMFRPPNNAIGLIHDEWGQLQVTGEVLVDATGIFGTLTHPDTTLVSPLTSQYYVGKGITTMQIMSGLAAPDALYVDVGNVPTFEFVPNVTVLTHYTSRLGIRSKDLEVIHEKQATLNITMDEFTYRNLQLTWMGKVGP